MSTNELKQSNSISDLYRIYTEKSELLYRFSETLLRAERPHDYGTGEDFTMTEMHVLTAIDENPGITVTELADLKQKTLSAISQTIKRLTDKECIEKQPHPTHKKKVCYYATEKGKKASNIHKQYDVKRIQKFLDKLMSDCSAQDLDAFFKVIQIYCNFSKED